MRCLVTGAGGFVGRYLVEHLLARGDHVCAWVHKDTAAWREDHDRLLVTRLSLTDGPAVKAAMAQAVPELVFHLAAQSYPSVSWDRPGATFDVNAGGAVHLLDAIRESADWARVVMAGSSAEYAASTEPVPETAPTAPSSPYGVSKLAQSHVARLYGRRYDLDIVTVRPFFLVGPGKEPDVTSDLARRIVAVEQGRAADVPVGCLDIVRDFLDVRDGVEAFSRVAAEGVGGEVYNICSGTGRSIRELLDALVARASCGISVREDAALVRPVDEPVKLGDPSKLRALGWTPKIGWEQTLDDVLAYWRKAAGGAV